jgi:4-hydroxy-tetrahydrodipicolinate reductase
MNIALVGTGSMGQAVERLAVERGDEIVARFDSSNPLPDRLPAELHEAQAIIDFSLPELMAKHYPRYCDWGIPAVIGTTGWYDRIDHLSQCVERTNAAIIYSPNFSIGVALLVHAIRSVAPILNNLPEYDVAVHEAHHRRKADSPGGTALWLGSVLMESLDRKDHLETETQHGRIDAFGLHVSSTRVGSVFGEHTVFFDSPFDQLRLAHIARTRDGFAHGALRAADWIQGKTGFFSLDDMIGDLLRSAG